MTAPAPPEAHYGHCEDALVLSFKGRLHYAAAEPVRAFFERVPARDDETVIIDLRELVAIDSTGMGLLARVGRKTLERGRRAVIVCSNDDVGICLRSAAFDRLFLLLDSWPLETEVTMHEVPRDKTRLVPHDLGRLMLEAHRELAGMSDENRRTFANVISALESEVGESRR
jgi:anti-anti-sigma factor